MQSSERNKTCCDNRNKVKHIIRNGNFVCATFPKHTKEVKLRNLASGRILHSFNDLADLHPDKMLPLS